MAPAQQQNGVDLWLTVCVYTRSEVSSLVSARCSVLDFDVSGLDCGLVRVYWRGSLLFVLSGHDACVAGVWTAQVGGEMVLVTLDVSGVVCTWGLDSGTCLGKQRFAERMHDACMLGGVLCLLSELALPIMLVDVRSLELIAEIGGHCFSAMEPLVLRGTTGVEKLFLACETLDEDVFFFDIVARSFASEEHAPELLSQYSRAHDPSVEPGHGHGGLRQLANKGEEQPVGEEPLCGAPELEREGEGDKHVGGRPTDLASEDENEDGDGDGDDADRLRVGRRRPLIQLGCSEVFLEMTADGSALEPRRANELAIGLPDEIEDAEDVYVVASDERHVCLARRFSNELQVFELEGELHAPLRYRVCVDVRCIDVVSISPFRPLRADEDDDAAALTVCLVDATLARRVVVVSGLRQVASISLSSCQVDEARVSWLSPFRVYLGSAAFDMLNERLVFHHEWAPDALSRTTARIERLRHRTASSLSAASDSAASERSNEGTPSVPLDGIVPLSGTRSLLSGGAKSFSPRAGVSGWALHVNEVTQLTPTLKSLMAFFMVWGLDDALDAQIEAKLGIRRPAHDRYRYVVDAKLEEGMVSLLADPAARWRCSNRFTAVQTLGLVSLFICLTASDSVDEGQQAVLSSLVSHYGIVFPELLIKAGEYKFPCFEVLTRFVLSGTTSEDVQIAARLLLQVSIERMPTPVRVSRAAEWAGRLQLNREDKAAVVVLGMMGCVNPQELAPSTARLVACALRRLVPGRAEETVIAAELLARGFYMFCPYLEDDLPGLIRDLVMQQQGEAGVAQPGSPAQAAQRALTEIGTAKPQQLIRTLGLEALRPRMHRAALMSLSNFVKKRPVPLLRHLATVVEVVIKTLDPSESETRKACLKFSTVLLHQLVTRYPMVDFHQDTQRFAVGTVESIIIIYDLRTATKWRILEGHKGPISALAFDPGRGETIVSYCAEEPALRLWQTGASSGFFGGLLGIQGSCIKSVPLSPLAAANKPAPADIIHECTLDWQRLVREDGSEVSLRSLGVT